MASILPDRCSDHGRWSRDGEFCGSHQVTILGTPGDYVLTGTTRPDVISRLGGDDVICGGSGDDLIFDGEGKDELFGQLGNDGLDTTLDGEIDAAHGGPPAAREHDLCV